MFFISVDSKGVKVICFDTLLQVLISKELEENIIHGKTYEFAREPFAETPFCLGCDLSSEKEKAGEGSRSQGANFNES